MVKKLIHLAVLILVLGVVGVGASFANNTGTSRDCLQVGCGGGSSSSASSTGGGGASTNSGAQTMTQAQYCAACQQAANAKISAAQQPPSLTIISDARAAARASVSKGVVDRSLRAYWPGGYPAGGVVITRQ